MPPEPSLLMATTPVSPKLLFSSLQPLLEPRMAEYPGFGTRGWRPELGATRQVAAPAPYHMALHRRRKVYGHAAEWVSIEAIPRQAIGRDRVLEGVHGRYKAFLPMIGSNGSKQGFAYRSRVALMQYHLALGGATEAPPGKCADGQFPKDGESPILKLAVAIRLLGVWDRDRKPPYPKARIPPHQSNTTTSDICIKLLVEP